MGDPNFEFNAPKFYDFEQLESDYPDANGDQWFDTSAVKALRSPSTGEQHCELQAPKAKENQPQSFNQSANSNIKGVSKEKMGPANHSKTSEGKRATCQKNTHTQDFKRMKAEPTSAPDQQKQVPTLHKSAVGSQPPRPVTTVKLETTIPHSPQLATSKRVRPPAITKTSQEIEWERVMKEAAEAQKQLKENAEHYKKNLQPSVNLTKRSVKPLTQPQEFELQTNKRQRSNDCQAECKEWKSLAQQTQEILRRDVPYPQLAADKTCDRAITDPKAPNLSTAFRARPSRFKSREQLEEEELAKLPIFHAKPVSKQVLQSRGEVGLPKVDKRPVTEPHPFCLQTDHRAHVHHPEQKVEPEQKSRKPQDGGVPAPQPLPRPTVPQSPALATKQRAAQHPPAKPAVETFVFRAQPLPDFAHRPSRPKRRQQPAPPIKPQPFNLKTEQRGEIHQAQLEAAIAKEHKEQQAARNFKAQPVPIAIEEPEHVPVLSTAPLTIPEPFPLRSMQLHEQFEQQKQRELELQEQQRIQMAQFKARPLPVADPFVVQPSDKILTVPDTPHFATDDRAMAREIFDGAVAEKMRFEEELKAREAQEAADREAQELQEYRRTLNFKARPMPDY